MSISVNTSTTLDTKQEFWLSMFKPSVLPSCPVFNINARTTCGNVPFTLGSHSGTRTFALLAQKQHPKRYLAISVLNGPTPYLLHCVMARQTTPLCMVSSGSLVHYVGSLQMSKGGTSYNILTAFSASFKHSTAGGSREIHPFVPYHQC